MISLEMFDEFEFEGLLAEDTEDTEEGPGLGSISPEHSSRIESHAIKLTVARAYILISVNLRLNVNALPGFMCLNWSIGLSLGFVFSNDMCKIENVQAISLCKAKNKKRCTVILY